MKIANIDLESEVLVIAEVGNNHEGSFELAQRLVTLAARSGAHIVKFQTIHADTFVSPKNTQRYEMLKKFELSDAQFEQLANTAREEGIHFMSTPFDFAAVSLIARLAPAFKVASGDNNFFPLLERIAQTGKPIILSTGLATLDDIATAKACIETSWKKADISQELALLHCVSAYPVPPEQANLKSIVDIQERFDCVVGYSDHTLGIDAAIFAVAAGARIVEKHFTVDKNYSSFRDHQLSADPKDFATMVARIRDVNAMRGSGLAAIQPSERDNVIAARRSIVAGRNLVAGHHITFEDLGWMRPAHGLPPGLEGRVIGKRIRHALSKGDLILEDNLE